MKPNTNHAFAHLLALTRVHARIHALTRRLYDAATPDAEREGLRDQIARLRSKIGLTFDVEAAMDQAEREELCHNK